MDEAVLATCRSLGLSHHEILNGSCQQADGEEARASTSGRGGAGTIVTQRRQELVQLVQAVGFDCARRMLQSHQTYSLGQYGAAAQRVRFLQALLGTDQQRARKLLMLCPPLLSMSEVSMQVGEGRSTKPTMPWFGR